MKIIFKPLGLFLVAGSFLLIALSFQKKTFIPLVDSFTDIEKGFTTPPDSVKPSVYWYWLSDNISKEGVTRDLEAMAKVGIGRAFIGNIGLNKEETSYGNVKLFSEEWWQVTEQAIRTGSKVGVDIGLFNSPGWSQSGGPWVKPEQSMRYLSNSEFRLKGPQKYSQKLPATAKDFQDVALMAFPVPDNDELTIAQLKPRVTSSPTITNAANLIDGKSDTEALFPEGKYNTLTIDLEVTAPFIARSLVIAPAHKPFRADAELQVSEGGNYRTLKKFELNRTNPDPNVGFIPYGPVAVSFPTTQSTHFRIVFTNMQGTGGLSEIGLSTAPRLERYVEKQLAKMFQTPLPLWNEYQWPLQSEPDNKAMTVDPSQVINLTKNLSADGTLNWNVPKGNWVIIRYGMLPTGVTNAPASIEGRGPEVDKMSKQALEAHFNAFVGKVLERMPANDRKALKYVVADSYETGSQNWTNGFTESFTKQYGYDPLPWLPVLTGRIVGSADQSDRFLWDVRRMVADAVSYQYVGGLRELSHKHGLKVWLENYGHWGFPGEFLQYGGQADEVGGEFWNEGELGSIECRAASSAAHIYGKNKVSAESFTAGGQAYLRYPALLKKRGDWSFTEGINNTLMHVVVTQPYEERNPGVNAGFGTEFNRKNTWFEQSEAFVTYLRRCMFMLQQGKPANDVAYFIGEDAPKMTGARNPELPQGYSYDYINGEVIMNRVKVKDGNLVLPDGMTYRMLVLPPLETMRPELIRKIRDLVAEGATILGPAPKRSPSLQNFPASDVEVKKIATELWSTVDGKTVTSAKFGKGMVINGMDMKSALDMLKVIPDFNLSEKQPVLYIHRTLPEGEIYFVTNQSDQTINLSPAFRVTGKQPELWDAVTGTTRTLPVFSQKDGSTIVPLQLAPFQSGFVIFRKPAASGAPATGVDNFPKANQLSAIEGPWQVTFDPKMRGPEKTVVFDKLIDWTKSPEAAIKHYSGTAIYRSTFKLASLPKGEKLYLSLGTVKVMAKVKVNGVAVGSTWTAPWQVEVTNAVKKGENTLEIEVVNTWVNRLIGDQKLPVDQRKTWTNVNPYTAESPLDPSGLMGPVTLQAVKF
ncbi:MAG: glycosyl hydrolase [Bacteroidota bacterium]